MVARYPLPIREDVRDLLVDLLGRGVSVERGEPFDLGRSTTAVLAAYTAEDGSLAAVVALDAALACRAGAALVMAPPTAAEEALAASVVPDDLVDNVREIAALMARQLNGGSSPVVALRSVHLAPGDLPDEVAALLAAPEARRDLDVTIEGYGAGRLAMLVS